MTNDANDIGININMTSPKNDEKGKFFDLISINAINNISGKIVFNNFRNDGKKPFTSIFINSPLLNLF